MSAPHATGYEANIGLKREHEAIDNKTSAHGNELAVRWILSFWIWVWLTLLLGLIAIPLTICEIVMTWKQEKGEIKGSKLTSLRGLRSTEKRRDSGAPRGQGRDSLLLLSLTIQPASSEGNDNRKMDPTVWKSDNFSRSREPKGPISSSPDDGLSPRKSLDLDLPSNYDDSGGEGNIGLTPKTGEASRTGLQPAAAFSATPAVVPPIGGSGYHSFGPGSSRWKDQGDENEKEKDGDERGRGKAKGKGKEKADKDEGVLSWSVPTRMNLIQPLPLPSSPGAPYFTGKDVTAFIQLIEDLFEDCQIPLQERRAKIVRYCARDIRAKVERMEEYREERFSLDRFYRALRFQYRDRDEFQQKYTVKRLDEVVREGSQLPDDRLEEYLDLFHDISTELTLRGILSRYDRGVKFMKGLPRHFRAKIGERHHFNPMDPETVDYQLYFDTALRSYRDRRNIQELDDEPVTRWAQPSREPERPAAVMPSNPVYVSTTANAQRKNEDDLVNQFMGLHLNASEVRSRLNETDRMRQEIEDLRRQLSSQPAERSIRNQIVDPTAVSAERRGGIFPNPYRAQVEVDLNAIGPRYGYSRGQRSFEDAGRCFMCWNEPGPNGEAFPLHDHVKDCPIYGRFFELGVCWYDSDQEDRRLRGLYWGRPFAKGMRIQCNRREPYWKQVVAKSKGSAYDVDLEARKAYLEKMERSRPQMDPHSFDRMDRGHVQPADSQEANGKAEAAIHVVDILNDDFEDFGRLTYEELAVTIEEEDAPEGYIVGANAINAEVLDASAAVTRSKAKKGSESAREILLERQRKEAKFAKPKHMRPAAIVQDTEDMDYAADADVEESVLSGEVRSQGGEPIQKAVRFSDQQKELSEVAAMTGGSVTPPDTVLNTRRRGPLPYQGLTSAYGAGDILLEHFANSKLDITVAQYIATSKEGREFLAKGLKEIETPDVHRAKPDSKIVVDANVLHACRPPRRKPFQHALPGVCPGITRHAEPMGNGEKRVYPSPHIPVTIFGPKRGTRLAAMIDSGAAINMISRKLSDLLGLVMGDASEYDMRPVRGPMSDLDGVVDDVTITIGGMSFDVCLFVMSEANHHCILGQPFVMMSGIHMSGTADGMNGPEFAELFDEKRRKVLRMLCARPLRRKVTPARELLGASLEMDSDNGSEEN